MLKQAAHLMMVAINRAKHYRLALLSLLVASLLSANLLEAASFSISPIRVNLSAAQLSESVTISNPQDGAIVVQVSAVKWSQADGKDIYEPTRDILVSPPVATIRPGESQIVRVAVRALPKGDNEAAYRIFIQDVPSPENAESKQQKINVSLRLSVPVFVSKVALLPARLEWKISKTDQGALRVEASNPSTAHVQVASYEIKTDGGKSFKHESMGYVLPGQMRPWEIGIPLEHKNSKRLTVIATTDAGEMTVGTLDVASPSPQALQKPGSGSKK